MKTYQNILAILGVAAVIYIPFVVALWLITLTPYLDWRPLLGGYIFACFFVVGCVAEEL